MIGGLAARDLELIRQVFRCHSAITEVTLFGSRAQGNYRPGSDIDLAVWGNVDELQAAALASELDELPLPYRFDVVAMSVLRDGSLREQIERDGQSLYRAEAPAN